MAIEPAAEWMCGVTFGGGCPESFSRRLGEWAVLKGWTLTWWPAPQGSGLRGLGDAVVFCLWALLF